jgi:hypothetical protein
VVHPRGKRSPKIIVTNPATIDATDNAVFTAMFSAGGCGDR